MMYVRPRSALRGGEPRRGALNGLVRANAKDLKNWSSISWWKWNFRVGDQRSMVFIVLPIGQ